MAAVLGLCLMITPYFIFIGIVPLLFMEELGMSLDDYVYYQGSIVGLFAVMSLLVPTLLKRFNVNQMLRTSIMLSTGAIAVSFLLSLVMKDDPLVISSLMWVFTLGLVLPPTLMFAEAMDMHPELRACASSLIQSVRMFFMAVGTGLAGLFYNDTYRPVVFVMLMFVNAAVPFAYFVVRRREGKEGEGSELVPVAMH
jgi:DHA1 family bicyclomycin/chloramphenicol resistance-like MFS transporter